MSAHDLARAQGVDDALHSFPMCTDKEGADNDAYVAGYQETRQLLQTLLSDQKRELLLAGLLLNTPDTTVQELARSRQALMHVQAVTAMAMRRMEQGQEPDARLWAALIGAARLGGVSPDDAALRFSRGRFLVRVGKVASSNQVLFLSETGELELQEESYETR